MSIIAPLKANKIFSKRKGNQRTGWSSWAADIGTGRPAEAATVGANRDPALHLWFSMNLDLLFPQQCSDLKRKGGHVKSKSFSKMLQNKFLGGLNHIDTSVSISQPMK